MRKLNKYADITNRPLDGYCFEIDGDYIADDKSHDWITSFKYTDYSDNGWLKQYLEMEGKEIEDAEYSIIVLKEK